MGLKPEHHTELHQRGISRGRFTTLRRQYANDNVTLQQIDIYDSNSRYNKKFRQYLDALKVGNGRKQRNLERWFKRHYPDIGRK